ncbi:MAG: hypothetical protein Q9201_002992 [Fulgogasparrea decipioides]
MSKYPSLQIHPGRGLGFLILGASLHDVLTRLKAQPHLYPTIDLSYSPTQPLIAPIVLNLPANGFRLRFDGPDQRLRLIEVLDFGKTQLSYKNIDLVKLPEEQTAPSASQGHPGQQGPAFRHVYNRLMGPTFPGEYLPPKEVAESQTGLYVLSYPGIAFTFPLQHSAWSPGADFVSLLSSSAAAPAKSLAIFDGAAWHEARQDLFTRPCLNPRSLALSTKGKEHQPDEVELVNVRGGGVVDLIRRSSAPFRVVLGETTPQDLVAELGPPDAIYSKNDHRLSIHKPRRREQRTSHGSYGASPARNDDFIDADQSSAHTTTDDSDAEDDADQRVDDQGQSTAKCFYNYFHHGFDIFISYPSNPSPPFPRPDHPAQQPSTTKAMDRLVATKVLLHGNVPGSYPFNRYRRTRWAIDSESTGVSASLDSETPFTELSHELRNIWKGNYACDEAEKATQHAIVLDRDWGDSPGSSYEVLEGWEDSEQTRKKSSSAQGGSGSGTTQIFGFPGLLFEVLRNDALTLSAFSILIQCVELSVSGALRMASGNDPPSGIETCCTNNGPWPENDMPSSTRKLLSTAWGSTLLLPKSSFPPRAIVGDRPDYIAKCTDELYKWQRINRPAVGHGQFVLHDGPPFANGPLHIGHALNKILKDITCRFQLSLGKKVGYVPGWDCHGLPIEIKALERLKKQRATRSDESIDPILVRHAARELAEDAIATQRHEFREWGIMADWNNAWKTMDWDFELRQLEVFSGMVKAGLIRRRFKPVYWSPSSRTALAEAELDYRDDHCSTAAYVKYSMELRVNGELSKVHALIWTTTPWTLPANRAIAVHSDLRYYIIETPEDGRLIVSESRWKHVAEEAFPTQEVTVIDTVLGKDLIGQTYRDHVFGVGSPARPILDAVFVSDSTGTGLVHIAPGHGMEDYELCLDHGISAFAPVDDAGRFTITALQNHPSVLANKTVLDDGSEAVIGLLRYHGFLVNTQQYRHKYPYDWRTKLPVIVRATEQWFADVGQIQASALDALDHVNFIPTSGQERLKSFVKNRQEWCISRQRAWGVPIPALYHKNSGKAILTGDSVDHIISEIRSRGTSAWWTDPADDARWIAPSLSAKYGIGVFRRGKDTMDVWFDSGTSWTRMGEDYDDICPQADVYLEGTDQHRGWFQSSLLTCIARQKASEPESQTLKAPFKTLITHGFVLDSAGRKMSKSVGNVISPNEIIAGSLLPVVKNRLDAMGPDALRLWVASSDYTSDVKVNLAVLKTIHTTLTKYRTLFKFILGNLQDFHPSKMTLSGLKTPHRIALLHLHSVYCNIYRFYNMLDYAKAVNEINHYIARDLSGFYLETVKDALYLERGEARVHAQSTLLIISQCLQTMLAPVAPLLVEETWEYTPKDIKDNFPHPLHVTWDKQVRYLDQFTDSQLTRDIPTLDAANTAIKRAQEKARRMKWMGGSLDCFVMLQVTTFHGDWQTVSDCYNRYLSDLATLFVVSHVEVYEGHPPVAMWLHEWIEAEPFEVDGVEMMAYVYKPNKAKCKRCWRYLAPLGGQDETALCERCRTIVQEIRQSEPSQVAVQAKQNGTAGG